ncbi:MAG: hypothetical protein ABGY75_08745 [Gemmataceae bacterium]
MSDDDFLAAFEACTIPKADWTHEAHVRMAWLYLSRLPFPAAVQNARSGISKYNRSLGNTTGYHDTVTVAAVRVIAARMADGETYPAFRTRNPDLFGNLMGVLRGYYSEARIMSPEAVAVFVEPDVRPLPVIGRPSRGTDVAV